MAESDKREPISFDFLYESLGLTKSGGTSTGPDEAALQPSDFHVNQAWILFRLLEKPFPTVDAGEIDILALMDAASTCILNQVTVRAGHPIAQIDAKRLLTHFTNVEPPPYPAKSLYVPTNLNVPALLVEAERLRMRITRVHEDLLLPFIGEARASVGERFSNLPSSQGGPRR